MLNVLILQCRTNIFMNKGSALLPIKNKISKLRILELTNYRHNSIISDKIVYFREHVFLNSFTRGNCNIELAKTKYILIIVILLSITFPIESIIFKFASSQVENFQSEDKQNNIPFSQEKPEIDVSIDGTSSDDKIKGGEGDDDINGRLGNDLLFGGRGDDELDGDEGDDVAKGEQGNDEIEGGEGNDKLDGERGMDLITGDEGDDRLYGGRGDDQIDGGDGNDQIDGGDGVDILIGGLGSDTFICDQFDTIFDYKSDQGDKKVGPCSLVDNSSVSDSPQISRDIIG